MEGQLRKEMLVALSVITGDERGKSLFAFASPKEEEDLKRIASRFLKSTEGRRELKERIRNLTRFGRRLAFEETHPDWILEHLAGESPRLIALVTRFLSVEKMEYILGRLTRTERQRFPRSFRTVSPEILEIVRQLVEKKLGLLSSLEDNRSFSFSHLNTLNGTDLRRLFRDLGLQEIGTAFYGLDSRIIRAFLSRCTVSDAIELRERMRTAGEISKEVQREAQRHLLSINFGQVSPEELFIEIGLDLFAKASGTAEAGWINSITKKLSLAEGYRLKRFFKDKMAGREKPDESLQGEILKTLSSLAKGGKVRRYWREEKDVEITDLYREAQNG